MQYTEHYQHAYNQSIPYFDNDLTYVLESLHKQKSLVLASAYKMGDRRFLDYLVYKLSTNDEFAVFYDFENLFTIKDLKEIQQLDTTKKKIIVVPWYYQKPKTFTNYLNRIMEMRIATFQTVLKLESHFFDKPEQFFPRSNKLMEISIARDLLSPKESIQLLLLRFALDHTKLPESTIKKIISFAGGHIGLLKRLYSLAIQKTALTTQNIQQDPPTRALLLQLLYDLETQTTETNQKIGLISRSRLIRIPVLKTLYDQIHPKQNSLTASQELLLQAFLTTKADFLTLQDIHLVLSPHKPFSLWALYKSMARFTLAVKPQYSVRIVKGRGYSFKKVPTYDS